MESKTLRKLTLVSRTLDKQILAQSVVPFLLICQSHSVEAPNLCISRMLPVHGVCVEHTQMPLSEHGLLRSERSLIFSVLILGGTEYACK